MVATVINELKLVTRLESFQKIIPVCYFLGIRTDTASFFCNIAYICIVHTFPGVVLGLAQVEPVDSEFSNLFEGHARQKRGPRCVTNTHRLPNLHQEV